MATSLRESLTYTPQALKFGTSGRRGEVVHLSQLEVYTNARAELEYLQSLPREQGGIQKGEEFYFASDLRPSSSQFVPEQGGRGGLAQAISRAIEDAGMKPVYLGRIPTPALTAFALRRGRGSIMVTGSHIPFDRNGYKTNSAKGELLKTDEAPIGAQVEHVRGRLYAEPASESAFEASGFLKDRERPLPAEDARAAEEYIRRYTDFFGAGALAGARLLVYQHSAVGRDLLVELLRRLGAEVLPAGRSESFVPIDTENIEDEQLRTIEAMAIKAWNEQGPLDAVVSTDGDSDRPLLLAVDPAEPGSGRPCRVRFFGGDLVGMVVAEYLRADAVVVPISCNDALDRGALAAVLEPKTRIGSPFVIAGMERARANGRQAVCGWEANGGFLTGTDITLRGRTLTALPTRDALLPLLCTLAATREAGVRVSQLFDRLPRRFSKAALLRNFPRAVAVRIVERLSPADSSIKEIAFESTGVTLRDANGAEIRQTEAQPPAPAEIRAALARFFTPSDGFGGVTRINYVDGVRVYFDNGDVAHVRPSGNADELRIYAVADTQARADVIARRGVAEPDGILRRMEKEAGK